MIQITRISARNFLSFGNLELNISSGLVCVVGENRDNAAASSNGSGKSSLLEALYWGLYGKTIRKVASDQVIRFDVKEGCYVKVEFRDQSGMQYVVERWRGDRSHGNDVHFFSVDASGGQTDLRGEKSRTGEHTTQKKIETVIGLSEALFRQVVLFGQGGMERFSQLTDSEKKALLEDILHLTVYEKAGVVTKTKSQEVEKVIRQYTTDLDLVRHEVRTYRDVLTGYHEAKQQRQSKLDQALLQIENKRAQMQQEIVAKEAFLEAFEVLDWTIWAARRDERDAALATLEKEITQEYQSSRQEYYQQESLRQASYSKSLEAWNLVQKEHQPLVLKRQQLESALQRLRQLESKRCPTCGQTVQNNMDSYAEQIQALEVDLSQVMTSLDVSQRLIADCERRCKEYSVVTPQPNTTTPKMAELSERKESIKVDLVQCNEKIQYWQGQQRKKEQHFAVLEQKRQELLQLDTAKKDTLRSAQWDLQNYDKFIEERQLLLDKAISKEKTILQDLIISQEELVTYEVLQKIFGPQGCRSFLFESMLPEINISLNAYAHCLTDNQMTVALSVLTETQKGDTREKISLQVYNPSGSSTYQGSSSGEKGRFDIPLFFAFQRLALSRGFGIGLCFLDEPFENLDERGVDGMMTLLNKVSRENNQQIFVITHSGEFASRFTKQIKVVKQNGKSHIVV